MIRFLMILIFSLSLVHSEVRDENSKAKEEAYKLFEAIDMKNTYAKMVDNIVTIQIGSNKSLLKVKPQLIEFFNKYMGWETLKEDVTNIYVKAYSANELKQIREFYETPVGQKTIKLMPQLMQEGAKIGQQKVSSHIYELIEIINKSK